jgi:thiol:disulfide interchange protein DsbD
MQSKYARIQRAFHSFLLAIFCLAATSARAQIAVVGDGGPGPVKAPHLTAELVSLGPAIAPGGSQQLGLILTIEEPWHVYWLNPGDSGEPPRIAWTLPAGITAGSLQFPIPGQLPLGPLMDYGYEDEVALPVMISAASTLKPGPVHLDAQVSWLVCNHVCVLGKAHLGIDLTVRTGAPQPWQEPQVGALGEALTLIPRPLPAGMKFSVLGGKKQFVLTLIDGQQETDAEFYPYPTEATASGTQPVNPVVYTADQSIEAQPNGVRLFVPRSPDLAALPATLHGVFKLSDTVAYEVNVPVVRGEAVATDDATNTTAIGAIGLAFLGGILLNLMPCVFPVLFLKGLALVQSSSESRANLRRHGLVYALGILLSFWAIVAALLVLRATGGHAGWGFQLQSPTFVALLASLLFFLALSLAGQFEFGLSLTSLGSSLVDQPSAGTEAGAGKSSYAGSFFTGVLATVVATPCTAPLMGAAIGFALSQTAGVTFAVFTALALGLAAPYVLLSWQPSWMRLLPRPGAWMELLKQLTAVPLFASAIWLAWVYGQLHTTGASLSSGVDQIALLLSCFLLLAIAGWALGRWPAKWPSRIAALLLIAVGLAIPLSQTCRLKRAATQQSDASPSSATKSKSAAQPISAAPSRQDSPNQSASEPLVWQPYSQSALDASLAAGHPVFIDFTADWCLSCKFNEKAVLHSPAVESALREQQFTMLKADWTNSDPEITQKLASLGRAGVPTYVIYPAAKDSTADVLPELLTKSLVLSAIQRDTKP